MINKTTAAEEALFLKIDDALFLGEVDKSWLEGVIDSGDYEQVVSLTPESEDSSEDDVIDEQAIVSAINRALQITIPDGMGGIMNFRRKNK